MRIYIVLSKVWEGARQGPLLPMRCKDPRTSTVLLVWALGPQVQTSRVPPSLRSYRWVPRSFGRFSHSASCGKFPSSHPGGLGKTPTLAYYSAVSLTRCIPSISIPININRPIACPPLWLPNKKRLSHSWRILHLCPGPPLLFLPSRSAPCSLC